MKVATVLVPTAVIRERKLLKSNCEAMMLQTERGKEVSDQFINRELMMSKAWANPITSFPVTSENVMEWTSEMEEIVGDLGRSSF